MATVRRRGPIISVLTVAFFGYLWGGDGFHKALRRGIVVPNRSKTVQSVGSARAKGGEGGHYLRPRGRFGRTRVHGLDSDDQKLLQTLNDPKAKMTISALKDELRKRDLKLSGKKEELIERLKEHFREDSSESENKQYLDQGQIPDFQSDLYDDALPVRQLGKVDQAITPETYTQEDAIVPTHLWEDSDEEEEDHGYITGSVDLKDENALQDIESLINQIENRYKQEGFDVMQSANLMGDGSAEWNFKIPEEYDGIKDLPLKIDTCQEMLTHYRRRWPEAYAKHPKMREKMIENGELNPDGTVNENHHTPFKYEWENNPRGLPKNYGLTFEEEDEIEHGEEERALGLTPEQRRLRRERRKEIQNLVDWYADHQMPPHLRKKAKEKEEIKENLAKEDRDFDRNKGDWYDFTFSVPNLKYIKPVKMSSFNTGELLQDSNAIFCVYNKTRDPVYIGVTFKFNATLEILKKRRGSQMEWIRYYILPKYKDPEKTMGVLIPMREGWKEQLGFQPVGNGADFRKWEFDPPRADPGYEELKPSLE
ncbi:hypothetical protein AAMO2058_001357800 [Amorphochlora amoebiformis]